MSQYHKKDFKHRHAKLIKRATKLALNLAILAGFVMLIWYGYLLFTHKVAPLIGSIVFIVGIAVWVILIRILRKRYKWTKPSFKLTTFSVITILLILTFAGIQPLASYKDNLIENFKTAQAEWAAERERAEAEATAAEEEAERTEFDEVTDGLSSPALVLSYMKNNFSYDFEKYQQWMAGDFRWDTPEEVFHKKMGDCGGHATFALYCLLKNGYKYNDFDKHKDNAAVILGCWNSAVPNYHDTHTVLLYIEKGLFYTIDKDRIDTVSKKGSFNTVEEAATASLPTWTVCYFYNIWPPRITQTVEKKVVAEQEKQTRVELMERQVVDLVNDIRVSRGSNSLVWDSELYTYSKQHSEDMANQKRLFHTSMYEPYAENAWGGEGSTSWTATDIVDSWMSSQKHRTWLLCPHLKHIAVGIAISNSGMYASWTFWRSETQYADWWYVDGTSPPSWWY